MSTPQFHLRRAIASDLDAILALERATDLAPHWPPSAYAAILAAPMGSSIEGNDPGVPFIPRSLRNGWETASQSSGRIDNDKLPLAAAIQRCLIVAEMNEQIIGFAVGLLQPGAPFIPRSLRNEWETASQSSGRNHIHKPTDASTPQRIAELESVVVSASARRAGIGRALCRAVFDWSHSQDATEVVLEVRASSSAAIALYASLGFTLTARRPRYYQDPADDALLMRLPLQPNGGRIDD
jgi:ribosomal protein S18 acetylase RimI-like enzyme